MKWEKGMLGLVSSQIVKKSLWPSRYGLAWYHQDSDTGHSQLELSSEKEQLATVYGQGTPEKIPEPGGEVRHPSTQQRLRRAVWEEWAEQLHLDCITSPPPFRPSYHSTIALYQEHPPPWAYGFFSGLQWTLRESKVDIQSPSVAGCV